MRKGGLESEPKSKKAEQKEAVRQPKNAGYPLELSPLGTISEALIAYRIGSTCTAIEDP